MKKLIAAAIATAAFATPVAAQTSLMMIGERAPTIERASVELPLAKKIKLAAEEACGDPFIRDLKAQQIHQSCVAEVTEEIEAKLAGQGEDATIVLAAR